MATSISPHKLAPLLGSVGRVTRTMVRTAHPTSYILGSPAHRKFCVIIPERYASFR